MTLGSEPGVPLVEDDRGRPAQVRRMADAGRDSRLRNRARAEPSVTSRSAPLILVVDDFDDAREMYRDYLEFSGFRVVTARDGLEAIQRAGETNPDLILMDLSLPGIDGWEATRRLKSNPATSHLLIVALSAHALSSDWDRAREVGCDGFIAKPCLPPDLVVHVAAYLKLRPKPFGRDRRSRADHDAAVGFSHARGRTSSRP